MTKTILALPLIPLYLACILVYLLGSACCWLIAIGKQPFVAYERWYERQYHR